MAMEQEFYGEIKARQMKVDNSPNRGDAESIPPINRKKKFTGKSIFANESPPPSSPSSIGKGVSARQRIQQQEFKLVRNAESSLVLQLFFVLGVLIFTVAVGYMGGITDGSDRFNMADMIEDFPTPDIFDASDSQIVQEQVGDGGYW
eukprot:CAMPEP_0118690774 /NCGR_PEP_ID=MMETSP0800-20121206/10304_1 /TAXON_ID=210618 ORGANISM="Striatella unipunctata, Strain CCMP2910" /NCGR_SAMPLE_ID=MMETSP0800 /ASSEMBLY_ACC=CAM_ASM_000638 /LENGTH=146 /DNA_ID=CAMNT_0006588465 /DNA_START=167 /DNA_END=604 /DNA_ORIENTATION=+